MTTQVFRGRTLIDARQQAVQTLGQKAVILTTREVKRSGLRGILGGVDFEVAAAVMDGAASSKARVLSSGPFTPGAYQSSTSRAGDDKDALAALRAEVRGEMRAMKLALSRSSQPPSDLVAELLAIRETLDEMTASTGSDKTAKLLALRGIEGAARSAVVRAMRSVGDLDASPANQLRTALGNLVSVTPWPLAGTGRAVLAVVGPAGVGKTTTIAKLATLAKMENKTVTLVTCDTFRVGAVEQIKRYASLLDVPCEIAKDAKGLAAIIASAETDLILVDTSGRPFRADTAEGLLAPERFAAIEGARALARHVILCMPASVRWADAVRTVRTFASAKATSIAVTKIDETDAPAGLLHGALASKLPLSILCTGPRVPEDIEAATCQGVALRVAQNPSPDKEGKAR